MYTVFDRLTMIITISQIMDMDINFGVMAGAC